MYEYKGPAQFESTNVIHLPAQEGIHTEPGEIYVEVKIYKNKPKSTLLSQIGPDDFDRYVDAFWRRYPKRNGKHLNKSLGQRALNKIKPSEIEAVLRGAENFSKSKQAQDGFAPDAHRWLARQGWKEWQEGEEKVRNRATL